MTHHLKRHRGFTMTELLVTLTIAVIPILAITLLLIGNQRIWQKSYTTVNGEANLDAITAESTFSQYVARANRANITIYLKQDDRYNPIQLPVTGGEITGDALELRFWADEFEEISDGVPMIIDNTNTSLTPLDARNTGTHYAFFYVEGDRLLLDIGEVQNGTGAITSGIRQTDALQTQILAESVLTDEPLFRATMNDHLRPGCLRMHLKLNDITGDIRRVYTAANMYIEWPRENAL